MEDEWTTVTAKKRGPVDVYKPPVQQPTKAVYVPPSARSVVDTKKPLDLQNETLFPSLGSSGPALKGAWAQKSNFKQTVEQLIVKDKQTVEEKIAAEEERRAMEGWASLAMPKLNADWCSAFHRYIGAHDREADRTTNLVDLGLYVKPIDIPKTLSKGIVVRDAEFFRASQTEELSDEESTEEDMQDDVQEDRLSDVD